MGVGFTLPAAAQGVSRVDVSGGYQFISGKSASDDEWEQFPKGWYFDVAGNVTDAIGIVGEVGGNYKTIEDEDGSFNIKVHPFMVGVRGSSRASETVVPFGQVLIGGVNLRGSGGGFSASETDFGVQVGAGVDLISPNNKVGARVGVDYIRIVGKNGGEISGGEGINIFRLGVGIVIQAGGTR